MNAIQLLSHRITRRFAPDLPPAEGRRQALRARFSGAVSRVTGRSPDATASVLRPRRPA